MESNSGNRPRLRDLGITIGALPTGLLNAITDVAGVRVGHTTVIHGDGALRVGKGPARTGVTAIHPHEGSAFASLVPAAIEVLNGAGEMTGRSQIDEYGLLESPILITNTLSVGAVHRACVEWLCREEPDIGSRYFDGPIVAETFDGWLNDIAGQHVTSEHTWAALDEATSGPVEEGNVGGGTGMRLFGHKGGIGTASRVVTIDDAAYTIGVLVQGNFGMRADLLVDGVPVGRELAAESMAPRPGKDGSVIVAIATDAPLSDRQLGRLCRRGMLGLSRSGGVGRNSSGDILIAFSNHTANRVDRSALEAVRTVHQLADSRIDELFVGTIEATEEAVLNALVAAETMTGRDGNTVEALPHDRLVEIMRRHGRLHNA
ncbi:MAG: P1 family peptidase [Chloroflexota bacterium]|nr:P1 family peptidase [Chloroflexota bacterium]